MPEGDTIHRTAATLRAALVGHALTRVDLPRLAPPHPESGARVETVEARGKHLLIHTSDGLVVHTHQRMTGSWHLYRPGQRWQRSPGAARVVLATAEITAVCFAAPVVEVLDAQSLRRHPALRRLGPDLCVASPDIDDALARLARLVPDDRTIGEALLDQRVASGIGNVYRCEVLFLHGLSPSTALADVPTALRRDLLDTAASLLRANLLGSVRTTVAGAPPGSLWVYGRAGKPCRRCGSALVRERLGDPPRAVDSCLTCQRQPGEPPANGAPTVAPQSGLGPDKLC